MNKKKLKIGIEMLILIIVASTIILFIYYNQLEKIQLQKIIIPRVDLIEVKGKTWVEFYSRQCEDDPWKSESQKSYSKDETIKNHYRKQGIIIFDIKYERSNPNDTVCAACGCAAGPSIYFLISDIDLEKFSKILDYDRIPPGFINNIINANNNFAFDLYSEYKSGDENIFFSPYSISTALVMTYEGAGGQTAKEMQNVFYFPEDDLLRRSSYASLYNKINKDNQKYELNTANALWLAEDFYLLDNYKSLISNYYGGRLNNLDFKKKHEESRKIINTWVQYRTKDKIKDLIPAGSINPDTRMVLTNAIYFKGAWTKEFDEAETRDRNFRLSSGQNTQVKMMKKTGKEAKFAYTEDDEVQVLEMPYFGENLSMLILLPKDDDIKVLENSITNDKLTVWKNNLKEQRVDVFIPRFKFKSKYFMAETLVDMGMSSAFNESADFSGISNEGLYISDVIHQAFVEVNEKGTEAAAATAVIMDILSLGPDGPKMPVFMADHPFIFVIQEKDSGNILFMGRLSNPSQKQI